MGHHHLKIPFSPVGEYICETNLNLYDAPNCQILATQSAKGRQLKILTHQEEAIQIYLCEDGYIAWLSLTDICYLKPATISYQSRPFSATEIAQKIPEIVDFMKQAMTVPNIYLWGGTIAPNYDCSGLIQAAFAHSGIWLPRDSFQQEEFCTKIQQDQLQTGDLIFFGKAKVTHVALYLEDGYYIHSSGKEIGNNKIAINCLSDSTDPISSNYYQILWSYGRIKQCL